MFYGKITVPVVGCGVQAKSKFDKPMANSQTIMSSM